MTVSTRIEEIEAELESLGCVCLIWTPDDVRKVRPELSAMQVLRVLEGVRESAEENGDDVERVANDLFGELPV